MASRCVEYDGEVTYVRACLDGSWAAVGLAELPDEYLTWSFGRRVEDLQAWREGRMPPLAGPHCAAVASYGGRAADGLFSINNAIKGIGWLPRAEYLHAMTAELEETHGDALPEKLKRLEGWYRRGAELFDRQRQCSLELFTQGGQETQTYRNMLADPRVALVFFDITHSYELHCLAQVLAPEDTARSPYEQQVVRYTNAVHDYVHGNRGGQKLTVIYHVVAVYDNSPGSGRGRRLAP